MILRILVFLLTSLPVGLSFEDVQQSLGILQTSSELRMILNVAVGAVAGLLAAQSVPDLKHLIRIRLNPTENQNVRSSEPVEIELNSVTSLALLGMVMNFVVAYSSIQDFFVFVRENAPSEIRILYVLMWLIMGFTLCYMIWRLEVTTSEKFNLLGIASLGGALAIGFIAAQYYGDGATLLRQFLIVLAGGFISWCLIMMVSMLVLGYFILVGGFGDMINTREANKGREARWAGYTFLFLYVILVVLSVFDLWRPLAEM